MTFSKRSVLFLTILLAVIGGFCYLLFTKDDDINQEQENQSQENPDEADQENPDEADQENPDEADQENPDEADQENPDDQADQDQTSKEQENQDETNKIQDISDFKPLNEGTSKNIFFTETLGGTGEKFKNQPGNLDVRSACSIESAALKNPKSTIFVVFIGTTHLADSPVINLLKSLKNVVFVRLDLLSFSKNTPLEEWLKSGKLFNSKFLASNISNVVRFLLLWK
jgi:DNA mismatch repair ATPase MutL